MTSPQSSLDGLPTDPRQSPRRPGITSPNQPWPGPIPPPGQLPRPSGATGPPKKNTKVKLIAIVAACLAVACFGGGASMALLNHKLNKNHQTTADNNPVSNASGAAQPSPSTSWTTTGKVGQAVSGHTFQFTVSKIKCGVTRVGSSATIFQIALGQYCLVTLSVKNIGGTPTEFVHAFASVKGSDDLAYQADVSATFVAAKNMQHSPFAGEMSPGDSLSGILVFDIPKKVKLVNIKLPDGLKSRVSIDVG